MRLLAQATDAQLRIGESITTIGSMDFSGVQLHIVALASLAPE
jgi:hypothetical protein